MNDFERIAVRVRVISQYVEHVAGRIFFYVERVIFRDRAVIHRSDFNRDFCRIGSAEFVFNRVFKRVRTGEIGGGNIVNGAVGVQRYRAAFFGVSGQRAFHNGNFIAGVDIGIVRQYVNGFGGIFRCCGVIVFRFRRVVKADDVNADYRIGAVGAGG